MVKAKVVEIRWHDMTPIFSCDFHAISPEQHRKISHGYMSSGGDSRDVAQSDQEPNSTPDRDGTTPTSDPSILSKGKHKEEMWRLATCGGDKNIRLWLVRPHPSRPPVPISLTQAASSKPAPPPPQQPPTELDPSVEYLTTLRRHTGVVNVVRFNPVGEMLASASDDGNIIFWVPGMGTKSLGETDEDTSFDREHWRPQNMCRTRSGQELYDLAFSPNGEHVIVGSIDHSAMIYDIATGSLVHTIVAHAGFVQGVAWDPYNYFVATQSSDRSMHVYSVAKAEGALSVHAVGKNTKLELHQIQPGALSTAASSASRTHIAPVMGSASDKDKEKDKTVSAPRGREELSSSHTDGEFVRPPLHVRSYSHAGSDRSESSTATSASRSQSTSRPAFAGTDTSCATPHPFEEEEPTTPMDPPHLPRPSSRRSSTSGSHPSHSPALNPIGSAPHPVRSPSPAPLPAVRVPLSPTISAPHQPLASTSVAPANPLSSDTSGKQAADGRTASETIKLYADSNATFYFRRLAWSPDGSLLLTPAGIFEDPYATVAEAKMKETGKKGATLTPSGIKKRAGEKDTSSSSGPKPTVYIYSRANLARPPIAHLPGHRTTSIAIRFCPILWRLRTMGRGTKTRANEDEEDDNCIDLTVKRGETVSTTLYESSKVTAEDDDDDDVIIVEDIKSDKGKAKAVDAPAVDDPTDSDSPRSLFDLPYRMIYAVATLDCVYLYDTQQAGPIAMFANLHYAPFTDLAWSADGKTLVFSAEDGYCTVVAFKDGELGTPYEKEVKRLDPPPQIIAPITTTEASASTTAPSSATLPALFASPKANPTATTAPSTAAPSGEKRAAGPEAGKNPEEPPAKKKKKAVLTHHGPLGSGI